MRRHLDTMLHVALVAIVLFVVVRLSFALVGVYAP